MKYIRAHGTRTFVSATDEVASTCMVNNQSKNQPAIRL